MATRTSRGNSRNSSRSNDPRNNRPSVADTLEERGATHGSYREQSFISQKVQELLFAGSNAHNLAPQQKEAIQMIAHKLARICCGSHTHLDNYHDIAGYATLAEEVTMELLDEGSI